MPCFQFFETLLLQGFIAFFRVGPITLKALKRKKTNFVLKTIGDHVRKRRLELGLSQKAVARLLRVTEFTVINWEKHGLIPPTTTMGRVIKFLGYDPLPIGETVADRLRASRRQMGWSQKQLGNALGVDPCTVQGWEAGGTIMMKAHRCLVAKLIGIPEPELYAAMRKRWNDVHDRPSSRSPCACKLAK